MKPIIIKVSKDKNGMELVSIPLTELQEAIDNAYEAGIIDGRRQEQQEATARAIELMREAPLEVLAHDD